MRVEPHPFFQREGDNIVIKVPVTVTEAGLGAKIEVPTIDGRALLKIPPGNAERTEVPPARERRFEFAEESRAATRSSRSWSQAPDVHDERTKEIAAGTGHSSTRTTRGRRSGTQGD